MELGPEDVSLLERCPHFREWYVQGSMELGPEDVSLLERCPHFRGWYVQASMELGPEDVSLLERCPHFRGWYVQASMELGPEDVSLLERCPRYDGCLIPAIPRRSVVAFGSWSKRPEGSSLPWKLFITAPPMMVGELAGFLLGGGGGREGAFAPPQKGFAPP